jgi:hypothetical protein
VLFRSFRHMGQIMSVSFFAAPAQAFPDLCR